MKCSVSVRASTQKATVRIITLSENLKTFAQQQYDSACHHGVSPLASEALEIGTFVQRLDVPRYNTTSLLVIPLENRGNRRINPAAGKFITFEYRPLST